MDLRAGFYERLFNFKEIRYFDIKGEHTGLFSRALTSPDGKIRIPTNESADEQSPIEEYLHEYQGEGIQRKGDEGFGEGNFRVPFVSIEEDQLRRGVLSPGTAAN